MSTPGLSRAQILEIAEKYGEFQYGDAQGHKRLEFAADVIAARERIRDAAPDLLEALDYTARRLQCDIDDGSRPDQWTMEDIVRKARAAIAKATGQKGGA